MVNKEEFASHIEKFVSELEYEFQAGKIKADKIRQALKRVQDTEKAEHQDRKLRLWCYAAVAVLGTIAMVATYHNPFKNSSSAKSHCTTLRIRAGESSEDITNRFQEAFPNIKGFQEIANQNSHFKYSYDGYNWISLGAQNLTYCSDSKPKENSSAVPRVRAF